MRGRSPKRFAQVCGAAYCLSFLIYAAPLGAATLHEHLRFGLAGFARFGPNVAGNALTGYELDTKVLLMWRLVFTFRSKFGLRLGMGLLAESLGGQR